MSNFKRLIEDNIQKSLHSSRIVLLTGARQTGKTTFLKTIQAPLYQYRTLDDPVFFMLPKMIPSVFYLKQVKK